MQRSFAAILRDMSNGPDKVLFAEMQIYCRRYKLDLFEAFLNDQKYPVAKLWLMDETFVEWMADRLGSCETLGTRRWFYKDQPRQELVQQALDVVNQNFIHCRDMSAAHSGYFDYLVKDHQARIVEPLLTGEDRIRDVGRVLAPIIQADGHGLSMAETKTIWDFATVHGQHLSEKPKLCAQPDYEGWCLHRISVLPDKKAPMPETKAFLARINDPEAFSAWLYGVASDRYIGRQVLWLRGEGSDGKSTFFKAFATLFGATAGSVDWNTLKANAGFAGSLFVNKRFVYVPDNANPELLNTGLFKSLSDPGSDPVTINHKYGKMYSTELEAHSAVLSNHAPSIRNETHSLSRALYLTIAPRDLSVHADKSITDRFIAELPGFLAYGKECYEERCRNNTEIQVNEAATVSVQDRVATTAERWQAILDEKLVLDKKARTESIHIYTVLTEDCRLTNNEVGSFREWLTREHKIEWKQISDNGRRPRFYIGVRLKTSGDRKDNYLSKGGLTLVSNEVS